MPDFVERARFGVAQRHGGVRAVTCRVEIDHVTLVRQQIDELTVAHVKHANLVAVLATDEAELAVGGEYHSIDG